MRDSRLALARNSLSDSLHLWVLGMNQKIKTMKKFKTNIKCGACVAAVKPEMDKLENTKWEVDLSHPERILTIQGEVSADRVTKALEKAGYRGEEI
ncbi:hypothetical protein A33Q_2229 [Indibacter alkaliphilus LW1]|uniref:Uncharacterized protein n=2 Tax=Indibacter TaxID=647744 RepID=S2DC08_INDAL|nr:hypothetical protein A33Q_2229 [Indibacter alkaliphilus LW1]